MSTLRNLLLLLLLGISNHDILRAQDLIIKITGDTLRCKVEQANDQFVYYRTASTKRGESDVISRKEVREIIYAAYSTTSKERNALKREKSYETLAFWGGGGYSRVIEAEVDGPDGIKEYYNKLNNGYWYGGGFNYFVNAEIGFGAFYSTSEYSNTITVEDTITGRIGPLTDYIRLQYVGLNFVVRMKQSQDNWLTYQLNLGPGWSMYENDAALFYGYALRSNALGIHFNGELMASLGQGTYIALQMGIKGISHGEVAFTPADDMPADLSEQIQLLIDQSLPLNVFRLDLGLTFTISF